jgi:hypothetical protein
VLQVIEGRFRKHAASYETVCQWVNAIKYDWEETDDAPRSRVPKSVTDELHVEHVESVFQHMHIISYMAVAAEVRISPASVYCHQQLWEMKS